MEDYLKLLQVGAVTVVACVIIVGAAADLFALDITGTRETGDGAEIKVKKYRGFWACACRMIVFGIGMFLTAAYTTLLGAIIWSILYTERAVTAAALEKYFIISVSVTILSLCWLALITTAVRWGYMKNGGIAASAT